MARIAPSDSCCSAVAPARFEESGHRNEPRDELGEQVVTSDDMLRAGVVVDDAETARMQVGSRPAR